jgi:hypothetical protein
VNELKAKMKNYRMGLEEGRTQRGALDKKKKKGK